jgi:alpha-glucosidase
VPIPWEGDEPPFGFSPVGTSARPWLPQPPGWRDRTVAALSGNKDSILELYRRALRLRRGHPALGDGTLRWLEAPEGALLFAREPGFICAVNISAPPVPVPGTAELILASGPLTAAGEIPPDTTAWLASAPDR